MNLSQDKPDLLRQDKLADAALVLFEYNDQADGRVFYQQWNSPALSIFITYSKDLTIIQATNHIRLEALPNESYYLKYKHFVTSVVAEKMKEGKALVLGLMMENLLENSLQQTWHCDSEIIEVWLSEAMEVAEYTIRTLNEAGTAVGSTRFVTGDVLQERGDEVEEGIWHRKHYHANGHVHADYYETGTSIRVGQAHYFNEDGSPLADHNFDSFPYHPVGYRKAQEIAGQEGVAFPKGGLHLYWHVKDDNYRPALYIDAITGHVERVTRPEENTPAVTEEPIRQERSFSDFLRDLVGMDRLFIHDGECICGPEDYVSIFHDLVALARPALEVQKIDVRGEWGKDWSVEMVINGAEGHFTVKGNTDWFDSTFIQHLNSLLRASGSSYTYYLVSDVNWGQEIGYVYLHDSLAQCVCAYLDHPGQQGWGGINNLVDRSSVLGL